MKEQKVWLMKTQRKNKDWDWESLKRIFESSNGGEEPLLCDLSDDKGENAEEDNYVSSGVNYYETHLVEDWLQCIICRLWVYENRTEFDDMCSKCDQKKTAKHLTKSCHVWINLCRFILTDPWKTFGQLLLTYSICYKFR